MKVRLLGKAKSDTSRKGYDLLRQKNILPAAENFGRFDAVTRGVFGSAILALNSAGLKYGRDNKQNIGLILSSARGCLESNRDFFKDYLDNGRQMGRGNIFIYTLPTSPLAEVAIYCGFYGPMLYVGLKSFKELEDMARLMIQSMDVEKFLLFKSCANGAQCRIISR